MAGLRGARKLLADIVDMGLPGGGVRSSWTPPSGSTTRTSSVGAPSVRGRWRARSTGSLASGLSMPVGIKNRTDGDVGVAVDALVAARRPHLFPSLTKEGAPALLETSGNEDCHLVLRGGAEPNYDAASVAVASDALRRRGLEAGILVDCSHGNSRKDPARQEDGVDAVLAQRRDAESRLVGIMLESHLVAGRQNDPVTYGQSITDACLGWADTERLIRRLAEG